MSKRDSNNINETSQSKAPVENDTNAFYSSLLEDTISAFEDVKVDTEEKEPQNE